MKKIKVIAIICVAFVFVIGVWLNGRVAVSKTVGCGFESYHPCQKIRWTIAHLFCFGVVVYASHINAFAFRLERDARCECKHSSLI